MSSFLFFSRRTLLDDIVDKQALDEDDKSIDKSMGVQELDECIYADDGPIEPITDDEGPIADDEGPIAPIAQPPAFEPPYMVKAKLIVKVLYELVLKL